MNAKIHDIPIQISIAIELLKIIFLDNSYRTLDTLIIIQKSQFKLYNYLKKMRMNQQINQQSHTRHSLIAHSQKSTNSTLLYYQGQRKPTYYLAAYTRLKIISISNVKYIEMSAMLNVQIKVTISYKGLSTYLKNQMLNNGIRMCFEKDDSMILKRDNLDVQLRDQESKKLFEFTVRRFLNTRMDVENLIRTPFQKIKCKVLISLNKVKFTVNNLIDDYKERIQNYQKDRYYQQLKILQDGIIQIHFNMMDNKEHEYFKVRSLSETNFGIFQIAQNQLKASYKRSKFINDSQKQGNQQQKPLSILASNEPEESFLKKNKKKYFGPQRPESFNYAHFDIILFKKPILAIATIFLPMLLLSIINLGIFFQDNDLHKRIVSVGALLVSFVALVPVIRGQIPPTPKITFIQVLVFIESLTTILALVDSLNITINEEQGYYHEDVLKVPLFLISLIITCLIYALIAVALVKFFYVDLPNLQSPNKFIKIQTNQMNFMQWCNDECDEYFHKDFDRQTIKVIQDAELTMGMILKSTIQKVSR